jgi:hypothetical protein
MNSDEEEDESEFMDTLSKVKEEEIICLDVGGERHYVRRGLLTRLNNDLVQKLSKSNPFHFIFFNRDQRDCSPHVSATGRFLASTWKLNRHLPTLSLEHLNLSLNQT